MPHRFVTWPMARVFSLLVLAIALQGEFVARAADEGADERAGIELFEAKIRPILVEHCYPCHSAAAASKKGLKANLYLDRRDGLLQGGDSGPAVVPGKPTEGTLLRALQHTGDIKMPPAGKLPDAVLRHFNDWIARGAPAPKPNDTTATVTTGIDWERGRAFWAFRPPVKSPVPTVQRSAWPLNEIDHFVLAELEKRKLTPAEPASKRDLLRRVTFDLTGLPPTLDEIDAFLADESPRAFERVVDRLLSQPSYGERWARHWLDISRYAEDKALAFVNTRPHAYRYRDWVVEALNRDVPHDRFLKLQLAGDLLPDNEPDLTRKLAGLGFQGLGAEYHRGSVTAQVIADELDDRVDTVTRGLLGLTVACARCHDHKYDPIPTRDYYSLAAAYNGSNLGERPLAEASVVDRFKAAEKKVKLAEEEVAQWLKSETRTATLADVSRADEYFTAAWTVRALQQRKRPVDVAAWAREKALRPVFVERVVKLLEQEKFDKLDTPASQWFTTAKKELAQAQPENDRVPLTDALREATETFRLALQMALPKAQEKDPPSLLKTLWLNPNTLFHITDKEAALVLSDTQQKSLADRKGQVEVLRKEIPPAPPMAHVISGGGTAMRVNLRGNVERQGEPAPPGFLTILRPDTVTPSPSSSNAPPTGAAAATGTATEPSPAATPARPFTRLELAEAIASPSNPLTARVIVNRVWHYHFGRGIVGTTSNFGSLGDRPTHPELLDTLAVRFVENGWSLRWLHREMLLSRTYQQSSRFDARSAESDPENMLLWRFAPRRLDFEAWRDAWLAVSGRLDGTRGGPSAELDAKHVRRTLYSKISRVQPNALMVLFDFPDANVTSDRRSVTTVPQQQLFVLNSDFTVETAKAFSQRLEKGAAPVAERIRLAYRLAYGREPSPDESRAAQRFIEEAPPATSSDRLAPWEQFAQAILASNEFQWVD